MQKKEIILGRAESVKDVFGKHLKDNFFKDNKRKIACIPFMRNLIEYANGTKQRSFLQLTALLHWKDNSDAITFADLDLVYSEVFQNDTKSADVHRRVMDMLNSGANECVAAADGFNFEHKIVLAIAIRIPKSAWESKLRLEKFNPEIEALWIRRRD